MRRQSVDVSPLRRVNQAIWLLTTGARSAAFKNVKTMSECLADELVAASKVRDSVLFVFSLSLNEAPHRTRPPPML